MSFSTLYYGILQSNWSIAAFSTLHGKAAYHPVKPALLSCLSYHAADTHWWLHSIATGIS